MSATLAAPGPLIGHLPATVTAPVAEAYAILRADGAAEPVNALWLTIRSAIQIAREADHPTEQILAQALAAALGELIADLPVERQQETVQFAIHQAFGYAAQLRTPGFDQPLGASGHA